MSSYDQAQSAAHTAKKKLEALGVQSNVGISRSGVIQAIKEGRPWRESLANPALADDYVVCVFLRAPTTEELPQEVDGIPVHYVVTGPAQAL